MLGAHKNRPGGPGRQSVAYVASDDDLAGVVLAYRRDALEDDGGGRNGISTERSPYC